MRLSYAVVKDLKLFDAKGNSINVGLSEQVPFVDGQPINLIKLCPPGKIPTRFEITTLQVESNKKKEHTGELVQTDCQSLCSTAILQELNSMDSTH